MIPTYFIHLNELPLNANNKLDRRALPVPGESGLLKGEHEAPQGETEKKLTGIWQEVLETKRISRHDNFFNLGGDSFKIIRVHKKINQAYPGRINIAQLFIYPTIFQLARQIAHQPAKISPPPPARGCRGR